MKCVFYQLSDFRYAEACIITSLILRLSVIVYQSTYLMINRLCYVRKVLQKVQKSVNLVIEEFLLIYIGYMCMLIHYQFSKCTLYNVQPNEYNLTKSKSKKSLLGHPVVNTFEGRGDENELFSVSKECGCWVQLYLLILKNERHSKVSLKGGSGPQSVLNNQQEGFKLYVALRANIVTPNYSRVYKLFQFINSNVIFIYYA